MKLGGFLVTLVLFLFTAATFPTFHDACVNATGDYAAIIHQAPLILLVVTAVLPMLAFYRGQDP